jgi:hypothetical protein
MRRGIVTMLSATAVTGTVIAIAGFAAPASAGQRAAPQGKAHEAQSLPVIATSSYAGYEFSTRDFRYIHAVISVPNQAPVLTSPDRRAGSPPAGAPAGFLYPQAYIQLSNGSLATGDTYARTGVETCAVAEFLDPSFVCPVGVQWVAFIETFINSDIPQFAHFVPLDANPGDGIGFSIYYAPQGQGVAFTIYPPSGSVDQFDTPVPGAIFDHAAALADYTTSSGTPIPLPVGTQQFRLTQFQQGAVTTDAGNKGSWTGPWVTSQIEATSNGLTFPQGTVEASPSYLWTDGAVANGAARNSDAFGVWDRA